MQRIVRIKALIVFFAISALIWLAGGSWVTEPVLTTLALPFPTNLTTKKRRILNRGPFVFYYLNFLINHVY
ncbi:energy transducer TonB [Pediococcus acidilactici]|nr:energy transducer TonB [Pediococcus acidilactici]KAF0347909.1 energy transducer TonB [Pediococcus acidilactici]KAF0393904.1 energy transducer TonB [Pediococcus acidilactici]KAF0398160.1 energy transducer TonB [Pediococcus acidilactici]KAF0410283.1 energy transducer TonB [Pediococcus acidilactici]